MNYNDEIKKKMFGIITSTFSDLGVSVSEEKTNSWVDAYVIANASSDALTLAMVSDAMLALSKVSLKDLSELECVQVFSIIYDSFSTVGLLEEEICAVVADVVNVRKSESPSYFVEKAKKGLYLSKK